MEVDLNRVAEKLKKQKPMGVSRDGTLKEDNPHNDGSRESKKGDTTLEPRRFFSV